MNNNSNPAAFDAEKAVAIIGGGLSGALVALQLLQRAKLPLRISVIEPRAELGKGVAYSTSSPSHLLNVRAGNMSIFPEEPLDFLEYLRATGSAEPSPKAFIERRRFGTYVSERLQRARSKASHGVTLEHLKDRAQGIEPADNGKVRVTLEDGLSLIADAVVLALGNNPPAMPFDHSSDVEIVSGWSPTVSEGIGTDEPVLIVGSGLTAVDTVFTLEDRGHRGPIHVVSRHGRWPLAHGSPPPASTPVDIGESSSVLTILKTLRAKVRPTATTPDSWQATFDQIRPYTNSIWRRLSTSERLRFLLHVRPLWEIHRHRMPPEAATQIEALTNQGQLVTHRGRVLEASRTADGFTRVTIASGNGHRWDLLVARLIVCTGTDMDFRKAAQPLIRELLDRQLGQLDPNNLGLLVSDNFALMRPNGSSSPALFALGPVIKGSLWETTALPEIRVQARDLATHLLAMLTSDPTTQADAATPPSP
jgi:uncharacterized NAD(P)/FAD-binding protein YdhS